MEFRSLSVILLLFSLVQAGHAQVYKPVLIVQPEGPQIFSGENVTLTCSIPGQSVADWTYYWYTEDTELHHSDQNYYIVTNMRHQSLTYKCYASGNWGQGGSRWSDEVTLTVTERPKASLILAPSGQIFDGEKVTLRCDIQGQTDTEWSYSWYKDGDSNRQVYSSYWKKEYSFNVRESDSGKYTCRGERRSDSQRSDISDAVTLTVSALPRATLTVDPETLFIGESVTLKCKIITDNGWTYQWYKQSRWTVVSQSVYYNKVDRDTLTIRGDAVSDGDQYQCRGERRDRPTSSQYSNSVTLTVYALPRATLTVEPESPVFTGESVTLKCEIESHSDWRYQWYKGSSRTAVYQSQTNTFTIRSAADQDQDQYWCRGERDYRPSSSQYSNRVGLSVEAEKSKPELTSSHKGAALIGNPVVLYCELDQSAGWKFYWSKHTQNPENEIKTETHSYSISSVRVSDGGQYWCRAGRGNPVYYTHYSDALWVNTTESPKAVVSIKPDEQVFRGETVTLRCDIQGGGDTEWSYSWNKDGYTHNSLSTIHENIISHVTESDSGKYTCRGERRSDSQRSEISDAVTLTVSDRAQAVLRVSPQSWLTEGDSVTLSCEVRGSSTGWTFSWYIAIPYRQGLTQIRDTAGYVMYCVKILSDSSRGAGGSYTLSPATFNHTGVYVCRGTRGETDYHTQHSNTQPLWITGVSSPVSLMVSPSRTQHFEFKSVSLSCEGQSDSTGWRVRRYTHSEEVSDCSSGWGSVTGSTCNISSLYTSHTGVYWCEPESGESSNPVNITVHNGFVILDSPVHPVTEGDPLTLHCLYRYIKPSNLTAEFYKDGLFLQTQTTGEMTIRTVSKSDEGLYHCKHPERGESPQSWISVRVSTSSAAESAVDLVGVVVGVSFAVLFIILLILLWLYRTRKGHKQNTNQASDQNQRESGVEDSQSEYTPMQAGDVHVYDTVERARKSDKSDAADESSDVIYSQVMTKNKKSKNKGKDIPAEASQTETIYSEVTDADIRSMEVTYAEIELKTKRKPKRKQEQTSVNADTVYSELKQNTDEGDVAGLDNSTSL